ncbi:class II fructose-bisphosphate aldolase [Gracilibacillus kekensis]|uniref:Fructose-bisphosphate aldolase, class II n=1 Tax=Gracilibacillus kekensis TaxID=1027249 RepID=A0A1M7JV05_9BACI|nr:class II fructose-bisphosphate aldolase [Gracilibacillus kekensis]SHM56892.1 fructose-bisphosphate aldolase, class II [Gracilibacillus kekensis]
MLVTLKENLKKADEGNYAVGQFNCPTLESARGAIEAAEDLQAPIILAHAEVHDEIIPIELIGPVLVRLAKEASVPVTVHLDHGTNLEMVKKAIDIGFSSVMIDASVLTYEENVNTVKEVVEYAHKNNVSVEAELGVMTSSGIGGEDTGGDNEDELYTDPDIAKDFVEKTNIDALAAAFGTVHGIYVNKPNLDYDRLSKIHDNIQRPVVMHGGSGLSEEEYINTINHGVRKINYYSYAAKAGADAVKKYVNQHEDIFYHDLTVVAKEELRNNYKKAISIFTNKGV